MEQWLLEKLTGKIQGGIIFIGWGITPENIPYFIHLPFNVFIEVLFGTYDENGQLIELNIPAIGNYENLVASDPEGLKGYLPYFEQWRTEGLI